MSKSIGVFWNFDSNVQLNELPDYITRIRNATTEYGTIISFHAYCSDFNKDIGRTLQSNGIDIIKEHHLNDMLIDIACFALDNPINVAIAIINTIPHYDELLCKLADRNYKIIIIQCLRTISQKLTSRVTKVLQWDKLITVADTPINTLSIDEKSSSPNSPSPSSSKESKEGDDEFHYNSNLILDIIRRNTTPLYSLVGIQTKGKLKLSSTYPSLKVIIQSMVDRKLIIIERSKVPGTERLKLAQTVHT